MSNMKNILLTSALFCAITLQAEITHYKVLDAEGLEVKNYMLDIQKDAKHITCKMIDEEHGVVKTDYSDYTPKTTHFNIKSETSDVDGEVVENILYYRGEFHSQKVDKSIPLDDGIPFVLNTRGTLIPFILSERESMLMYVTSSQDLAAYKFEAQKEGEVELKIGDKSYNAIEVSFSMTGFIGWFFSGDTLYFDAKTGKFLKRIDTRRNRVEIIDEE